MYIENLKIKNFGCIDNIDSKFDKVNLIMGNNGSGKSKFLSTIVYSLCDSLEQKIGNYVRTGSNKFEIDMNFNHVSNNYRIQIDGSKTGSDKLLTVNDNETYKNSAVVEYIKKYIHNPKLTLASSITMQGEGSNILFEPNQKRVERLKQIFNIDKLNDVGLYIKEQVNELKIKIKELEVEINTLDNTKYDYKTLCDKPDEKLLVQLQLDKATLEKEKSEYDYNLLSYNTYVQQLSKYENDLKKIVELNTQKEENNTKIVSLQSSKVEIDPDKIDKINIEIETLRNANITINENLIKLNQLDEIEIKIKRLQGKIKELVFGILPRQVEIPETLQEDIIKLSTEIAIMESKRQLVEQGKCHTCGQDYKEFSVTEFDYKLTNLNNDKRIIQHQQASLQKAKENYDYIKSNNEKSELNRKLLQDQLDALEIELKQFQEIKDLNKAELKENLKNNNDTYIIYKEDINTIQTNIESNNTIENNIKTVLNNNKIIDNDISTLSSTIKPKEVDSPVEFNDENYIKVCENLSIQETLLSKYDTIIDFNKMLKNMQTTNNKKIQDSQVQLDKLRNTCKLKEQTKKIIEKDFSSWLIDKGSLYVKNKMNEFFQKGYGKFIVDLKNEDKTVDFFYSEDSENFLNVGMASGYEKEVLAISFRIALCSMQPVGLLLLDEVDSFSQESNSLRLYQAILQEKDFEQIIGVTHYPKTQDYLISKYNCNVISL